MRTRRPPNCLVRHIAVPGSPGWLVASTVDQSVVPNAMSVSRIRQIWSLWVGHDHITTPPPETSVKRIVLVALTAFAAPAAAQTTALVGATVIDGTGKAISNGVIVVTGERIACVGTAQQCAVPANAT